MPWQFLGVPGGEAPTRHEGSEARSSLLVKSETPPPYSSQVWVKPLGLHSLRWAGEGSRAHGSVQTRPFAGKLLDATRVYQYVFVLAGVEVLASSLVLLLGNFFCLGKRPKMPESVVVAQEHPKPLEDVQVDSREVEHFLKAEPEPNGEVAHTPETSV